jgi:alkaline phosphatase D
MIDNHKKKLLELDASRRRFIRGMAAGTVAVGAGLGLPACGGGGSDSPFGDDDTPPADDGLSVRFAHGVASGDPLADRVILWTRASPSREATLQVDWELADDAGFATIVARGTVQTDAAADYTVKVDAAGLAAGSVYHYRFRHGTTTSPAGRTRTLPVGAVAQVRLAVFSCSNYPAGFFNVYAEAARMGGLDAAVHLGDYLYEYARGGYADELAAQLGRESLPATELLALVDYRARHAQYRSDPDLQALHAALPMIAVWDDHEISNDTWSGGAENHQPATEGEFAARRAAALRAYHEWMPVRLPDAAAPERLYRSFDFGTLLSLHMLDARVIARDEQLSLASYLDAAGNFDAAAFANDVGRPDRQLLGAAQTQWLQQQMQASAATWQVLGQQVLMGRMHVPAPVLFNLLTGGAQGVTMEQYFALLQQAQAAPGTLTPEQQALLAQPALPYNLDAWDGYAAAREAVLGMAQALDKNLVVLAGDTHNAWASDLATAGGTAVGVEFATPAVSSPGFEAYLPDVPPQQLAGALQQLIGPLQWADTHRRGFMVVTATEADCRADWHFVDTVSSRSYAASLGQSLRMLPGAGNRTIVAV